MGDSNLTRWDEREKEKSSNISNALLLIIGIFALGFVVGAIWGYVFADSVVSTPVPPAFGGGFSEATVFKNYKITLFDGITISDEAFIRP